MSAPRHGGALHTTLEPYGYLHGYLAHKLIRRALASLLLLAGLLRCPKLLSTMSCDQLLATMVNVT